MTARLVRAALIALAAAVPPPAVAGEAQDALFAVGVLDPVATGSTLGFTHERAGAFGATRVAGIEDGTIELTLAEGEGGKREARLSLRDDGRERPIPPLPARAGHPVLLLFLETTARNVAALTGGSPFYIRNRMREALGAQDSVETVTLPGGAPGERLSFRPFATDPHRAALRAFADLEIAVTVSDAVPGGIAAFEAVSGPGPDGAPFYSERIAFSGDGDD